MHFIIDDGSSDLLLQEPADCSRGLDLSARPRGYAYAGVAEPFPDELLIPRHEWQARIAEQEERGTHLKALCQQAGLPIKNQQRTNYCWIFAPTHALEVLRVGAGLPMVSLSPASAGAQIKNYRNQGGWGKQGLEWIVAHGVCPSVNWPDTAIDRRYATEFNRTAALDYRVSEWWELEPGNLDQHISCLLRNIPVAVGLDYWGHEVLDIRAVWINGAIGAEFDNSWSEQWGNGGRGIRQGRKLLADDAVAPRVAIAA